MRLKQPMRYTRLDKILDDVREIKVFHAEAAKEYSSNKFVAIEMCRKIWGVTPTWRYNERPLGLDSSTRLMLSALIAERVALYQKGYWKNVTVAIVGMGGSGKTTYSILSGYGAMRLLGYSEDYAMDAVSRLVFFSSKELVDFILHLTREKRWVPFIVVDDIGSQISKYWVFLGQHFWSYLFSVLDQVKDWTGVLVMTARSFESIPARLRELADLVVYAHEVDFNGVVLDVFEYYRYEDYGSKRSKPIAVDVMPPTARMPEQMWLKMMEVRRETALRRLSMLSEFLKALPALEARRAERYRKMLQAEGSEGSEGGGDGEAEAGNA